MDQTVRDELFRIGEVARRSGFPVKTIRYYEDRGLLEPASRNEAGYRLYSDEVLGRLRFIRKAKLLGLTLGEIHGLLSIAADCSGDDFFPKLEEVLDSRLRETRQEIHRLPRSGTTCSTTGGASTKQTSPTNATNPNKTGKVVPAGAWRRSRRLASRHPTRARPQRR